MELFEHVVDVTISVKLGHRYLPCENHLDLILEVPLVKQPLDTHLHIKSPGRLETHSDLAPGRSYSHGLNVFLRTTKMWNIGAIKHVHLDTTIICILICNLLATALMKDYSDPMVNNAEEDDEDCGSWRMDELIDLFI